MSIYNSKGWQSKSCDICGKGNIYIKICIATGEDYDFPFTEHTYCKKCFDTIGFENVLKLHKEHLNEF